MSVTDTDAKFDIILISFRISFAWQHSFLELDSFSRWTIALNDLLISKKKEGRKAPPGSLPSLRKQLAFGQDHRIAVRMSDWLFLMEEEVLCYSEGMRMLQKAALVLGNSTTGFFPQQIQENSGGFPKRRIAAVKNGGCSKQINQSPNTVILKRNCAIFSQLLAR